MSPDIPSTVSYTTGISVTIIGGLSLNQWAAIVGIATCIFTFGLHCFKVYWDIKHTERRSKHRDQDK
jgi:hypothetical protein